MCIADWKKLDIKTTEKLNRYRLSKLQHSLMNIHSFITYMMYYIEWVYFATIFLVQSFMITLTHDCAGRTCNMRILKVQELFILWRVHLIDNNCNKRLLKKKIIVWGKSKARKVKSRNLWAKIIFVQSRLISPTSLCLRLLSQCQTY